MNAWSALGRCNHLLLLGQGPKIDRYDVGKLNWREDDPAPLQCHYCHACLFEGEVRRARVGGNLHGGSLCCNQGAVCLPPIGTPDDELKDYMRDAFFGTSQTSGLVARWMRPVNSMLAMAFQKVKRRVMPARGMPTYVVNTRIQHLIGSLHGDAAAEPEFAQLYVHDQQANGHNDDMPSASTLRQHRLQTYLQNLTKRPSQLAQAKLIEFMQVSTEASERRITPLAACPPSQHLTGDVVAQTLAQGMRRCNPYVRGLINAADQLQACPVDQQQHIRLVLNSERHPTSTTANHAATSTDAQRANSTQYREVSVLLSEDGFTGHEFVMQPRGGQIKELSMYHPAHDPLYFVTFFPCGDDGWYRARRNVRQGTVETDAIWLHGTWGATLLTRSPMTARQFYCHRLHYRRGERFLGNRIMLHSGRLLQEYVCMAYATIEGDRLQWQRNNQAVLKKDTYRNVQRARDALDYDGQLRCGREVLLHSSFVGGPRDLRQRFQDALAIVRETRKPSLFITMTANPNWDEIRSSLPPGARAEDHPLLVARVFKLKLDELRRDLVDRHVLGHVVGYAATVHGATLHA